MFRSTEPFVAFYCLDDRLFNTNPWGFQNISSIRLQFLLDHLHLLGVQLAEKGVELVIRRGYPARELLTYMEAHQLGELYAESLPGSWEQTDEALLREAARQAKIQLHIHQKNTLIDVEKLPFALAELPPVFTEFRKKVERYCEPPQVAEPIKSSWPSLTKAGIVPTLSELGFSTIPTDKRNSYPFEAGEIAAQARLNYYFWEKKHIKNYKLTRNGMVGADFSSRFSPWLALGAISPRFIYAELKRFEAQHGANESTYWLYFELLWRDYFQLVARKSGANLFKAGGIQNAPKRTGFSPKIFGKWCVGETGQPFIDANMRELLATGWMSNRGRQNVASYLVHDLKQDWRAGAAWFEAKLIDYDPASNYGNWNYIAGVGNDPRENRRFNPEKQAAQYDPDGTYQRLWLS